jgi:hypothetical protein
MATTLIPCINDLRKASSPLSVIAELQRSKEEFNKFAVSSQTAKRGWVTKAILTESHAFCGRTFTE